MHEGENYCPACEKHNQQFNIVGFSWFPNRPINPDFKKITVLKNGQSIWRCQKCQSLWCLNLLKNHMFRVPEKNLQAVLNWSENQNRPSKKQIATLRKIRGQKIKHVDGLRSLAFPCRVILNTLEELDFCVVSLQNFAPFHYGFFHYQKIISFSQVKEIFPSDFALSAEIRNFSLKAPELDRDFFPTVILSPQGQEYTLVHSPLLFFKDGDLKGKDMRLLEREKWPTVLEMKKNIYKPEKHFQETLILGKL